MPGPASFGESSWRPAVAVSRRAILATMSTRADGLSIRRLDLATFAGDAWALQASLDVPPDTIARLVADGSGAVRWKVVGMSSIEDNATQVSDDVTDLDTLMIKLTRSQFGSAVVSPLSATSGTIVGLEVTESDASAGDVFVLAIPAITAGVGSAAALWIIPTAGFNRLPVGSAP